MRESSKAGKREVEAFCFFVDVDAGEGGEDDVGESRRREG